MAQRREAAAERRRERRARDLERFKHGAHGVAGVPIWLPRLGLTVAIIAVTLAVRVFVPLLLRLLSVVFGAGLRNAANRVEDAGRRAVDVVTQVHRALDDKWAMGAGGTNAQTSDAQTGDAQTGSSEVRVSNEPPVAPARFRVDANGVTTVDRDESEHAEVAADDEARASAARRVER